MNLSPNHSPGWPTADVRVHRRRWPLLPALVAVLVACGGPVTSATSSVTSAPDTTQPTATSSTLAAPDTSTTVPDTTIPEELWFEITVERGQPVGGVLTIEVVVGDPVRLRITSDTSDHVHIHGYDFMFDVGGGVPVEYTFTADAFGIFEIELEHTHTPIAELVVR